MIKMKEQIKVIINNKYFLPIIFIIVGILTIPAYIYARQIMITNLTWAYVTRSNITLNFVLFLFLWGVISTRLTKTKKQVIQWGVFVGGLTVIILFFKFIGGYQTIFG